jgi:4-amino-4-deoxy-L-arabinose transferase-like glycosyltransferase
MSETKTSVAVRPHAFSERGGRPPFPFLRHGLTFGGSALIATNIVLRIRGAGDAAIPIFLWGAATVCFFASFIVNMMESQEPQESSSREVALKGGSARAHPDPEPSLGVPPPAPPDIEPARTPLFRRGNPLRLTRGGITAAVASFLALVLMAHEGQLRWGVPLGGLLVAIASWGIMDLLGTFDDGDDRVAASVTLAGLTRPLLGLAGASLLFCLALGFAVAGTSIPQIAWGIVVTLAFVGGTAAMFEVGRGLGVWAVDEDGVDRPFWKRHGFWVVTIAAALYFPFMGTSSLWDPWETHYGEVSREILARDDWISLWWAQDGWFWSKPVLDMWMQAIAMATLGVRYQPDKMLVGDGTLPVMHPEWAVRAPVVLLTILALYLLYKGVAKTFGRRAALLGGLVLATTPDWYLLAHQTMTDMPCVAPMTACMGLVLLGLGAPEEAEARAYQVSIGSRRFRFSGWHLVFGSILLCAVPQILYLVSRNIDFLWRADAHGFHPHWDEFRSGSGLGDCTLPGNEECRSAVPASIPHSTGGAPTGFAAMMIRTFGAFEPAVQGVVWALMLGAVLYMSWGERRLRRLYYLAAWFFAAVATLGKGPEGVALPVLVTLAYLGASRPSEELVARITRFIREIAQFEIAAGLLIILVVAMPWYVAMYVRHGSPFTDRLIFHDMFNRAFHHVHDTNEGDDTSFRFYVWQLGYALFPWTGLAPLGLLWWLRRGATARDSERADVSLLLCFWFLFAFALFSFMGTKFHHYIFPAVPPVAMLIGVVLDDMLGRWQLPRAAALVRYLLGMLAGMTVLVIGVARSQPGSFVGIKPDGHLAAPSIAMAALLVIGGAVIVGLCVYLFPADALAATGEEEHIEITHASRMLGAGAIASALVLIVVARDLIIKPENGDQPGAIHLLQLFTYNYRRAWPDSLDFSAALAGFSAAAVLVSVALAVRRVRHHAVAALCALSLVWGVWGLDVYMQRTAQHWGQREVISAYYADRASPDQQLIAYQMNWKGENFYTGNHIPAFVSTGTTFTSWLKKQRDAGQKVMYFITEQGRLGGLKGEVQAKSYRELTDKVLCNKFVLVRAEL